MNLTNHIQFGLADKKFHHIHELLEGNKVILSAMNMENKEYFLTKTEQLVNGSENNKIIWFNNCDNPIGLNRNQVTLIHFDGQSPLLSPDLEERIDILIHTLLAPDQRTIQIKQKLIISKKSSWENTCMLCHLQDSKEIKKP